MFSNRMAWRKISIVSTCCHLDQLLSVLASVIDIPLKKRSETERGRIINSSLLLYGLLDQQVIINSNYHLI